MPFLVLWVMMPSAHAGIKDPNFHTIQRFLVLVVTYLLIRTWLAFKDPPRLKWEYVFPPIDVAVVSILIYLGERDPLSNIGLLYFFPLAQAAGTLNTRWVAAVAAITLAGAALATHGLRTTEPFNVAFRYFFIFVLGSLVTILARAAASLREQLGIARDRSRIAMEMHDGVQAHLMTLSKHFELVEHLADSQPARVAELAAEGGSTARLAADELRYLVNRLRAPSLTQGFIPALKGFVHNLSARHNLEYNSMCRGRSFRWRPRPSMWPSASRRRR